MTSSKETANKFTPPTTPEELSAFYKAALFRASICIFAVISLLVNEFAKAMVTVAVLTVVLVLGETVLSSLRLQAKFNAMRRVAREAEALRRQAALERERAKAEAAEKYFDLDDENLTSAKK